MDHVGTPANNHVVCRDNSPAVRAAIRILQADGAAGGVLMRVFVVVEIVVDVNVARVIGGTVGLVIVGANAAAKTWIVVSWTAHVVVEDVSVFGIDRGRVRRR